MLELLAGPFPVQDDGYNPQILTAAFSIPGFFVDGRGIYCTGTYAGAMGYMAFDGHFHQNGVRPQNSGWAYDLQARKILVFEPVINNLTTNPKNGHRFDPETGSVYEVVRTILGASPAPFYLNDRALQFATVNYALYIQASTDGGQTWANECPLPLGGGVVSSHVTAAGLICIANKDGSICFYDPVAKRVTKTVYTDSALLALGNFNGGYYSDKHDVYLTVHMVMPNGSPAYHQVRVWASTPQPAGLATPVAQSPLGRGQVTVFKTQLTGSNGEPCPNELIDWALTGNGLLLDPQSTTDAYGNATARYAAPLDSLPFISISATARV